MIDNFFKLLSTRVWRTYPGGAKIEEWQGKGNPRDGEFPEEWIASVVNARNPGRENIADEGLSKVQLQNGAVVPLKDIIDTDPYAILGSKHYEKYGKSMAILAKIIDSASRLTIQVHPDKNFAQKVFASSYGKTEAWYILGGRRINGEDPYVLLGFKPGVTREKWKRLLTLRILWGC